MASNLLAFVGAQLDQELKARKADSDVGTRVKHALKRSLAGKRPTLPDVAQELGTSARTRTQACLPAGRYADATLLLPRLQHLGRRFAGGMADAAAGGGVNDEGVPALKCSAVGLSAVLYTCPPSW